MAHRAFRVRDASRVPFHPHIARRRMPYIYHGFCRRVHMSSAPICWRSKTLHAISTRAHALPQVTGAWHAWSAFRCLCARRPLQSLTECQAELACLLTSWGAFTDWYSRRSLRRTSTRRACHPLHESPVFRQQDGHPSDAASPQVGSLISRPERVAGSQSIATPSLAASLAPRLRGR